MKTQRLLIVLAIPLIIGCRQNHSHHESTAPLAAYYVSIGVQTLTPVTSQNIEARGKYVELPTDRCARPVRNVLANTTVASSGTFSNKLVRVKLFENTSKGKQLIASIEDDGNVKFASGEEAKIDQAGMTALKTAIESGCQK